VTSKRKRPSRRAALRALGKPKLTPEQQIVAALAEATPCRRLTAAELEVSKPAAEVAAELRWAEGLRRAAEELAEFRAHGGQVN
jgi:hypothetical protein